MTASKETLSRAARRALVRWELLWRMPGLADSLEITFSQRLRTSLGRAVPGSGKVRLHHSLLQAKPAVLIEVLCHEAAHVAVARRAQALQEEPPRPHGPEWAALVSVAGYQPKCTSPLPCKSTARKCHGGSVAKRQFVNKDVVHTCPVCHMLRRAKRAVRGWRCAACVANGLPGELVIKKAVTSGQSVRRT